MMLRGIVTRNLASAAVMAALTAPAMAGSTAFCVTCVEPDRTYVCRVETPDSNPGAGALQYYCIVRTAREEGHKSCTVSTQADNRCTGIAKNYTYNGPALPAQLQAAINEEAADAVLPPPPAEASAQAKSGPPETLADMTSRARQAVREGLRATEDTARDAAETAEDGANTLVTEGGEAARETGSRVGNAARSVGRAARTAFGCVWSLFRSCGSENAN